MKTLIIFLSCLIISVMVFGQNQKQKLLEEVVVIPPRFTGIENVLTILENEKFKPIADYLNKNIQYPEEAERYRREGTVVVQFVVTPKGEVEGFNVINSVSSEIDDELIRVLKTTSRMWNPGCNNGEPVAMQKEVSMVFKIHGSTAFATQAKTLFITGSNKLFNKGKIKSALRKYNRGVLLMPYDKSLLFMRGFCKYELGNTEGALQDWRRLKTLGGIDLETKYFADNIRGKKGYSELISLLEKE